MNWRIDIPAQPGDIQPGENVIDVEVTGQTGFPFDLVYIDAYALQYTRPTVAKADKLFFHADRVDGYRVSGFSSDAIVAYGFQEGQLYRMAVEGGEPIGTSGLIGEAAYWISTEAAMYRGTVEISVSNPLLADLSADVLVLTHPGLMGSELDQYVSTIENRGYTAAVVNVLDIYETYNWGMPLPDGITAYLNATKENYTYVMIVGGTTTSTPADERVVNFVPTEYAFTNQFIYFTPSDGKLADFDGDDLPDKIIARLPARETSEILAFANKMDQYQPIPKALLIAEQDSRKNFSKQLDQLEQQQLHGYDITKVYVDDIAEANDIDMHEAIDIANREIVNTINSGIGAVAFSGHGSPIGWSFQGLLTSTDAMELLNEREPVLILPLSCYTTYYHLPSVNTMAHQLLFNPQGGAVGISGASTLSHLQDNFMFSESILQKMVSNGSTLGEAVYETKQAYPQLRDQVINWNTLGDPLMTAYQPSRSIPHGHPEPRRHPHDQ